MPGRCRRVEPPLTLGGRFPRHGTPVYGNPVYAGTRGRTAASHERAPADLVDAAEVGTLDLWCHSTRDDRRWKLEYNVREGTEG